MQTSMEANDIEILIIKDFHPVNNSSSFKSELGDLNACRNELQLLNEHQTLGEIHGSFTQQNLVRLAPLCVCARVFYFSTLF